LPSGAAPWCVRDQAAAVAGLLPDFARRAFAEARARREKCADFRCFATRAICSSVAVGCSSRACCSKRPLAAARAFAVRLVGSSVFAQLVCAARRARRLRCSGFRGSIGSVLSGAGDRVVVHVHGHGHRVNECAGREFVRRREAECFSSGDGRPVFVYQRLHLASAEPGAGGELSHGGWFPILVTVEQPSEQGTVVQAVAVGHVSPSPCPRFWTSPQ